MRELVASGEVERCRAQDWIDDLIKRSREASETLVGQVSSEVDKQLGERLKDLDLDDLAKRVAGIIELAGTLGRNATAQARDRVVPGQSTRSTAAGRPADEARQATEGVLERESRVQGLEEGRNEGLEEGRREEERDAESKAAKPAKSDSQEESSEKSADSGGMGS